MPKVKYTTSKGLVQSSGEGFEVVMAGGQSEAVISGSFKATKMLLSEDKPVITQSERIKVTLLFATPREASCWAVLNPRCKLWFGCGTTLVDSPE